jgi:murein DD-endopeptidase MepM/ murein hydrolase activator NlpD
MKRRGSFRILLIPEEGGEGKSIRLSYRMARFLLALGILAATAVALMAGSWWYLALEAGRVGELEVAVDSLVAESDRVDALARELTVLEAQYESVRSLFGTDTTQAASDLWLPPSGAGRPRQGSNAGTGGSEPTSWPLTERGFVTQGLLEGGEGDHPGIDIAVPTDSYIRAAGSGRVLEAGEDSVYGQYILLDHGNGYETRYGHASMLLVAEGATVRRNEVIGLTGSTGQSTAPHLHFEVVRNGTAIDPLSMVERPG